MVLSKVLCLVLSTTLWVSDTTAFSPSAPQLLSPSALGRLNSRAVTELRMSSPAFDKSDKEGAPSNKKMERLYQLSKINLNNPALTPKQRLADLYLGVQSMLDSEAEARIPSRRLKKQVDKVLSVEEFATTLSKASSSLPGNKRVKDLLSARPSMDRRAIIGGAAALATLAVFDKALRSKPQEAPKPVVTQRSQRTQKKASPRLDTAPAPKQEEDGLSGLGSSVKGSLVSAAASLPGKSGEIAPQVVSGTLTFAEKGAQVAVVAGKGLWFLASATVSFLQFITPWLWKGVQTAGPAAQVALDTTQNVILPTTQRALEEGKEVLAPVVQDGVEKAMPIVKDAYTKVQPVVDPYIAKAGSSVNEAVSAVQPGLQSAKAGVSTALQTSKSSIQGVADQVESTKDSVTQLASVYGQQAGAQIAPAVPFLKAVAEVLKSVFSWTVDTTTKLSTQGTDAVANEMKDSLIEGVKTGAGVAVEAGKTVGKQALEAGSSKAEQLLKETVNEENLKALGQKLNSVSSTLKE